MPLTFCQMQTSRVRYAPLPHVNPPFQVHFSLAVAVGACAVFAIPNTPIPNVLVVRNSPVIPIQTLSIRLPRDMAMGTASEVTQVFSLLIFFFSMCHSHSKPWWTMIPLQLCLQNQTTLGRYFLSWISKKMPMFDVCRRCSQQWLQQALWLSLPRHFCAFHFEPKWPANTCPLQAAQCALPSPSLEVSPVCF